MDTPKILVVDDLHIMRLALELTIASFGFDCVTACDTKEAIELMQAHQFNLVLIGCNMPGSYGFVCASAIREMEKKLGKKRIPIIGLSLSMNSEAFECCFDSEMDDLVPKECPADELKQTIKMWTSGEYSDCSAPPRKSFQSRLRIVTNQEQ